MENRVPDDMQKIILQTLYHFFIKRKYIFLKMIRFVFYSEEGNHEGFLLAILVLLVLAGEVL
ncbi:hypothetical protein [Anaerovibrio slackiae]|uniref:hypothetical protein n=1 Tax=Anaerovibrio slackiae TaxID=2652309 RepID=UPI003F180835